MKSLIRNYASNHCPGSAFFAKAAWWYLEHYNNVDLNFQTNGEAETLRRVSGNLQDIVDVGASIGEWSMLAKWLNPQATVYSLEPSARAYAMLKGNKELVAEPIALSDKEGVAYLHVEPSKYHQGTLHEGAFPKVYDTYLVNTRTLATWMDDHKLLGIDYLKIDTEGSDLRILSMAPLHKIRYIQFEHIPQIATYARVWLRDFYDLLSGFRIARITKQGLDYTPYNPKMETVYYANYFCEAR